jgi:hypothetical protein
VKENTIARLRGGGMIKKCCNPECDTPFDYREGRLIRVSRTPSNGQSSMCQSFILHFWLCGNCTEQYVLDHDSEMNVKIEPRDKKFHERKSVHSITAA